MRKFPIDGQGRFAAATLALGCLLGSSSAYSQSFTVDFTDPNYAQTIASAAAAGLEIKAGTAFSSNTQIETFTCTKLGSSSYLQNSSSVSYEVLPCGIAAQGAPYSPIHVSGIPMTSNYGVDLVAPSSSISGTVTVTYYVDAGYLASVAATAATNPNAPKPILTFSAASETGSGTGQGAPTGGTTTRISLQGGIGTASFTPPSGANHVTINDVETDAAPFNVILLSVSATVGPAQPLALSLSPLTTAGGVALPAQIPYGVPLEVDSTLSATGIDPSDTRSIQVLLAYGTQGLQLSDPIPVASLANGGKVPLQYFVTFVAADVGLRTIAITADPTNKLNAPGKPPTQTAQVMVINPYFLQVTLPDTPATDQSSSASGLFATVQPSTFFGLNATGGDCGNSNLQSVTRTLLIKCVDQYGAPTGGCQYAMSIAEGSQNGGHDDSTHAAGRPLVVAYPSNDPSTLVPINAPDGDSIVMTMPEIAGDNVVTITGVDPNNNPLTPVTVTFEVKLQGLAPMSISGLSFSIASHSGEGTSGAADFTAAIGDMVSEFQAQVSALDGNPTPDTIISTGASLSWGGLFDFHKDWETPHCSHRDGQALDVYWPALTDDERNILGDIVDNSLDIKFYPPESPGSTNGNGDPINHWHIMPR